MSNDLIDHPPIDLMCNNFTMKDNFVNVVHPSKRGRRASSSSLSKDVAELQQEKKISLIKAWEESEKSKAMLKLLRICHKKLSAIGAWANSKKPSIEAELKKIEERLEKQKAEYVEKMKSKVAMVHKAASEKRAMTEAKRGEDILKAEEMDVEYRATGTGFKKLLGCFSVVKFQLVAKNHERQANACILIKWGIIEALLRSPKCRFTFVRIYKGFLDSEPDDRDS
ncbi:remorin-like [Carya illinoinensis]|uniref:remorin-like n=1 Tax=Carya illinoinensis TaxID=32201 RepID=UPI001C72753D|nr:remorin-like [Carya illinoinensis]